MGNCSSGTKIAAIDAKYYETKLNSATRAKFLLTKRLLFEVQKTNPSHEIIIDLCIKGADINGEDFGSLCPILSSACEQGLYNVTELLIYLGANVNNNTNPDITPLVAACKASMPQIVQLLLDHGANPIQEAPSGSTPLQAACEFHDKETVELLLQSGASNNVPVSFLEFFVSKEEMELLNVLRDNNRTCPLDVVNFHLSHNLPDHSQKILQLLHFPAEFDGHIHVIGQNGEEIPLHFKPDAN
ncbi:MAG: ankyrin repeat domain-containing protein [Rickettsiaceae bacterium]|nr:ankyrin repeat domain-containing protein [Rickettsiaceae bacterium]